MPDMIKWLVVGDFNLYRTPEDRNKPGGDHVEMYLFNEAINALGLVELPLNGKRFTWTNKQLSPLLERLDWFFTSTSWTTAYPNTYAYPLVMETSDHVPCVISISTNIPRRIFLDLKTIGWSIRIFCPLYNMDGLPLTMLLILLRSSRLNLKI
jgi:hypothetical protein